ncbi:MAG: adenylate/guanylate cyclase domain-containing protein [Spirochaetes bacterium]|nr:adenylate/guanylate cyclase domain-containing protein [Spirochaetota bacterium]
MLLYAYQIKFLTLDLWLHGGTEFLIFLCSVYITSIRTERADIRNELKITDTLLKNLEGEKLNQVKKMLEIKRPAYYEELTILFSDIRNFTSLSEVLPADKVYSLLNEYYAGIVDIVAECGGVIDKFLGDGIMVVFGLNGQSDIAPEAAIRCAVKMRQYQQLAQKNDLPGGITLSAGIGIATGRVMVGLVGSSERFEWTVLGDPVNLAARLERMTRTIPTNILISESTWVQVREKPGMLTRIVAYLAVRGRFTEEAVIEVFNADTPSLAAQKLKNLYRFENALRMYKLGYEDATDSVFRQITKECPEDAVAHFYAEQKIIDFSH